MSHHGVRQFLGYSPKEEMIRRVGSIESKRDSLRRPNLPGPSTPEEWLHCTERFYESGEFALFVPRFLTLQLLSCQTLWRPLTTNISSLRDLYLAACVKSNRSAGSCFYQRSRGC